MQRLANVAFGLLLVCVCGAAPLGERPKAKVDLSGTWEAEVELGGNTGSPTFTLKQDGEKLTGKYNGQFGEADVTGKVKDDKVEFSFPIGDMGKAVYTGTFENGTLKGTVKYGSELSGTWTAKKKSK